MVVLRKEHRLAKLKFKCPDCSKEFASARALGPHRNQAHGFRVDGSRGTKHPAASRKLAGKFPCELCGFVAKWPGGLSKHMGASHPEVALPKKFVKTFGPFKCQECPRSFSAATGLGIHRRFAHGIDGSSISAAYNRLKLAGDHGSKRSELVKTTQNVITTTNGHGHIQVPTQIEDDRTTHHRLEAAATYAAGRVAQLLESLALQLDVSFRTLAPLVLRTVGETTKVR